MALDNGTMYMPVAPAYGNGGGFGFGGDWGWILLLLLCANGGWGGFGGFGGGAWGMDGLYPWMNNSQNINNGFRDQMLNDNITSIRDGVQGISTQLCNGFASIEQGANARQMADMQQMFSLQSALQNCCCENRAGIADLKYTVATENCADRTAAYQNTQAIIEAGNRNSQAILDKLCQLELDNVKQDNANLRTQLNMANLAASQTAQTAELRTAAQTANANLLSELRSCPIPAQAVYGNQPVFTCQAQNNCGCQGFYN